MKIRELVTELTRLDPNAEVYIETSDCQHFHIDHVFEYRRCEVYLECV
jgi:hypothetical protein